MLFDVCPNISFTASGSSLIQNRTSCSGRGTCIDYDPQARTPCNRDYGGCWTCTDSALPVCITNYNDNEDQFALYCGQAGDHPHPVGAWENIYTSGSLATGSPIPPATPGPTALTPSQTGMTIPSPTQSLPNYTDVEPSGNTSKTVSSGGIAGIAVGCSLGAALFLLLSWFLLKRHKRNKAYRPSPASSTGVDTNGFFEKNAFRSDNHNTYSPDNIGNITSGANLIDVSHAGIGLGINSRASELPISPGAPDSAQYTRPFSNLSVMNGISPPLPSGSTVDTLRYHNTNTAIELDETTSRGEGINTGPDINASATTGPAATFSPLGSSSRDDTPRAGNISPATPSTQTTTPALGSLGTSPPSALQSTMQSYAAYRPTPGVEGAPTSHAWNHDGIGRNVSLTSATGYSSGVPYASEYEIMRSTWRNGDFDVRRKSSGAS